MSSAIDLAEFEELYKRCSNWGRWGAEDQRGALNLIEPAKVAAAASTVTAGVTVSCGRVLDTVPAVDNPHCAIHRMTSTPAQTADGLMSSAGDYLGLECHGEVHSHLDALCHIGWRGKLHNGWPTSSVTELGASVCDLDVLRSGIVSRGVLLDIAALRGQRWLHPGDVIGADELAAAEQAAGLTVSPGDVVLVRSGHSMRRSVEGPWDSANSKAGLDPRALPWFKERDVAALAFDGDGEAMPHQVAAVAAPIHVLGINAMGLHFFDALSFEDLVEACMTNRRWEFLFVAAPLRVAGATGCAINPLAIF